MPVENNNILRKSLNIETKIFDFAPIKAKTNIDQVNFYYFKQFLLKYTILQYINCMQYIHMYYTNLKLWERKRSQILVSF